MTLDNIWLNLLKAKKIHIVLINEEAWLFASYLETCIFDRDRRSVAIAVLEVGRVVTKAVSIAEEVFQSLATL